MNKLFSIAAVLVLSGNILCGSVLTERIAGMLDSGGSFYQLADLTHAIAMEKRSLHGLKERLAASGVPEATGEFIYRLADSAMLSLVLAGAEGELAYGASSVPCPPAGYFRNTGVLIHGKNSGRGMLWHIFGSKNHDLTEDLHAVPANALLAADFEFHPAEAVPSVTVILERLFGRTSVNANIPEILKGMGGSWCILAVPLENQPLPGIMAAAPDKGGGAFRLLAELMKQSPDGEVLSFGSLRILHFKDGDMTVLYSSPECMDCLSTEYALLKDTPAYKALTGKLEFNGTGFVYTSPELSNVIRRMFFARTAIMLPEIPESLTVFRRIENGFKAEGKSPADFNAVGFKVNFSAAVNLLGEYVKAEYRADARKEKERRIRCRERLAELGKAIKTYQEKNHGAMPPAGALEGMTALLNSGAVSAEQLLCPAARGDYPVREGKAPAYENISYVYFGPWYSEADGNLPLMADWQLNHRNYFNVLLKNGQIVSFEVEKLDSCRRLASVLQSKYKYSEKDFRKLMATAGKLDKLFPSE